jgi:hypothetical protein
MIGDRDIRINYSIIIIIIIIIVISKNNNINNFISKK